MPDLVSFQGLETLERMSSSSFISSKYDLEFVSRVFEEGQVYDAIICFQGSYESKAGPFKSTCVAFLVRSKLYVDRGKTWEIIYSD